jgi:hypothetical protein
VGVIAVIAVPTVRMAELGLKLILGGASTTAICVDAVDGDPDELFAVRV